jgi:hypothetical protein
MPTEIEPTKFNEVQLHLLNVFSKASSKDLPEIKKLLLSFYVEKAKKLSTQIIEKENLTQEQIDKERLEHPQRTFYPKKRKQ